MDRRFLPENATHIRVLLARFTFKCKCYKKILFTSNLIFFPLSRIISNIIKKKNICFNWWSIWAQSRVVIMFILTVVIVEFHISECKGGMQWLLLFEASVLVDVAIFTLAVSSVKQQMNEQSKFNENFFHDMTASDMWIWVQIQVSYILGYTGKIQK